MASWMIFESKTMHMDLKPWRPRWCPHISNCPIILIRIMFIILLNANNGYYWRPFEKAAWAHSDGLSNQRFSFRTKPLELHFVRHTQDTLCQTLCHTYPVSSSSKTLCLLSFFSHSKASSNMLASFNSALILILLITFFRIIDTSCLVKQQLEAATVSSSSTD